MNYHLNIKYNSKEIKEPSFQVHDSLGVIRLILSYKKNDKQVKKNTLFRQVDDSYFELKLNEHLGSEKVDSIYSLAFSKKDTTYKYQFDKEKYEPFWPDGTDDWEYSIKKNGNMYSLIKHHLVNPAYIEEFIYDDSFKFKKINLYYQSDTLIFEK